MSNKLIYIMLVIMGLIIGTPDAQAQAPPYFGVRVTYNQIDGYEWPLNTDVTLTIDDPANGPGIDYTDTQTVGTAPWNPQQTWVPFNLNDSFQLQPGHSITLTDGIVIKEHVVTNVAVTSMDTEADTISGTASPNSELFINIWDPSVWASRHEVADASGNWTADFSTPGDEDWETITFDIIGGTQGEVVENDPDGDYTSVATRLSSPMALTPKRTR